LHDVVIFKLLNKNVIVSYMRHDEYLFADVNFLRLSVVDSLAGPSQTAMCNKKKTYSRDWYI